MTEQTSGYGSRAREQPPGWAVGFIVFAAVMMMMMMSGMFQVLAGLVAIFENQFHVATRNYTFEFDVTAWGWIHLVLGVIIALDVFVIWALAVHRGRVAT